MCKEWSEDFKQFYDWSMDNGYKEGLTIDRINVNGNYEPNNCRWVTRKTQMNNFSYNHNITFNGKTHTMSEWAEITGISYSAIKSRINRHGWSIEKALTKPARKAK